MRTTLIRFTLGLLLGAAFAGPAVAVTYQVGPGRTHTQITSVAGLLNPGDIVEVDGNATYNWVHLTRSGSAAQPIVIRGMAAGAQRPFINANSVANDGLRMDVDHHVIEDLVVGGALQRCVYLHGHNLTLRRVQVHTCRDHGILGADTETGNLTLTEVEVYNSGNAAAPSQFHHPIYIATDHELYPGAVLRIERSWVHDNHSGNSIKSRARNAKFFYNWLETTNSQNHTIEAIGPDGQTCPVPNGSNAALLCNAEIVGNVLLARGNNANMMRLGGDGTGNSFGRYHVVNNTFIANNTFNSTSAAMIRAFGNIDSIELHNNIFWLQLGDSTGIRIVRDAEANWVSGRRVTGTKNLVTGSASTYASGIPAAGIQGLTGTIFVATTAPLFVNVNLATPATIDLDLVSNSAARAVGNAGSTTTAGYEVPNPTNLPAIEPPRMRPVPGTFAATARPQPTNDNGVPLPNTIGLGAYEYAVAPSAASRNDFNGDGESDVLWHNQATGEVYVYYMDGTAHIGTAFVFSVAPVWTIAGTPDLNGDGKPDILWRNQTTGEVYAYFMDGVTHTGTAFVFSVAPVWRLAAMPDLNGDGKADILWHNQSTGEVYAYFMDGTTHTGTAFLFSVGSEWRIASTPELNADSKADILWHNQNTGEVYAYFMDGVTHTGTAFLFSVAPVWRIIGTNDVNANGLADIVWHNQATGEVYAYFMTGTTHSGTAFVFSVDPVWAGRM